MTEELKEDIKVSEEKDGSVTVEVPESMLPADGEEAQEGESQMAEGGQADDDQDHPDDTDAVREARRARRKAKKEYMKKVQTEKDERLAAQAREIEQLRERMAAMEHKAQNAEMARLEKLIQDEKARLNYAKNRMKEATERADGAALVNAQELYMGAKETLDKLESYKNNAKQQREIADAAQNPVVQRFADRWMAKNKWYDTEGKDPKSRLAKQIDSELAAEGWNPGSQSYWNELDARVEARLQDEDFDAYTDTTDETPRKRGPRSVVTGSEREIGGGSSRNTFTLSAEQVRAMKDAGFWDNKEKRNRMIQRYAQEAQRNRS